MPNLVSCVGVDGCRAGWIAVSWTVDGVISSTVHASPLELMRCYERATVIGVDVPIGLSDGEPRLCDVEARATLRAPRASSVFPPPIRSALNAETRQEACAIQYAVNQRRIGVQSWGILPKIRDWDRYLSSNDIHAQRVYEVHPEICFWALAGGHPMRHKKTKPEGRAERRQLLIKEFGDEALIITRRNHSRAEVKDDDLHDAFAALWSAQRIGRNEAKSVPATPPCDSAGLRMAIWF
jgi:predicted RNase H-like nuclease